MRSDYFYPKLSTVQLVGGGGCLEPGWEVIGWGSGGEVPLPNPVQKAPRQDAGQKEVCSLDRKLIPSLSRVSLQKTTKFCKALSFNYKHKLISKKRIC